MTVSLGIGEKRQYEKQKTTDIHKILLLPQVIVLQNQCYTTFLKEI